MRNGKSLGWLTPPAQPLLAAALIGFAGPVDGVLAQQGGQEEPAERAGEKALRTFDLDFKGGTAADFIDAVREARGGVNFLLSSGLEKIELPPVELVGVTLETVMEVFEDLDDDWPADALRVSATRIQAGDGGEPVYEVKTYRWPTPSPGLKSAVRSVSELMDTGWSTDDVLSALQVVMSVEQGDAEIKFHEATSLVILRGSDAQLKIADEALAELRDSANDRAEVLDQLHSRIEETRLALVKAEGEVELARSRLRLKEKNLEMAKKPLEGSERPAMNEWETAGIEHTIEQARVELRIAIEEVDMLASRLERLETKLREAEGRQ